jgi:sulfite reductase alpha subunit-like flavoprotein
MFATPRFSLSLVACVSLLMLSVVCLAQEKEKKEEESKTDDRLVCIGALASAHIYTTYGYVGTVADAYAHEVYKADKVQELMKEVVGLADVSVKQLKAVRNGSIVESDKKVIDDVSEVYGLLKEEAQALSDYTKSKDQDDLKKYEKARTTAWPKIKTVLGIKD